MEAYKAGSCRQAMFSDLKIHNSFTLENSFFLTTKDKKKEVKKDEVPSPSKLSSDNDDNCDDSSSADSDCKF